MQERSIPERLTVLEQKVEALESLPERVSGVEFQIVQLRADMSAGFSVLRGEMHTLGETLREETRTLGEALRAEMRNGDEETRRLMRILHEDVIARIAAIGQG